MKLPGIILVLGSLVARSAAQDATCAAGVYMIVARGTGEAPGPGRFGAIADAVANAVPDSKIQGLDYPAVFTNYTISVLMGVESLTDSLTTYTTACPQSKVALLGYSQGAQVTAGMLCGTSEASFNQTFAISSSLVTNVIAVVMMGDPSHIVGLPWDRGTSTKDGVFPRKNTTACMAYADKMQAYCDTGDIYCDRGSDTRVHGAYFLRYATQATEFIVSKFNESKATESTPTPTPSNTPGSAASPMGPSGLLLLIITSAVLFYLIFY